MYGTDRSQSHFEEQYWRSINDDINEIMNDLITQNMTIPTGAKFVDTYCTTIFERYATRFEPYNRLEHFEKREGVTVKIRRRGKNTKQFEKLPEM